MVEKNEKCTFKAPRGEKWNELNLTARAVYCVIAAYASYADQRCSCLSREKIASIVGIRNLDDVSRYTNALVEGGFLRKEIRWIGPDDKRCVYEITVTDNYSLVKNDIVRSGLSGKQIALFCTIASLRYQRSHRCRCTASQCGVSKQTFKKYIADLVEEDVIEYDNDTAIFKKYVMCDDYNSDEKLKWILENCDPTSRYYKMAVYAVEHPKSIVNVDAYVDYIWTGVRRHSDTELRDSNIKFDF